MGRLPAPAARAAASGGRALGDVQRCVAGYIIEDWLDYSALMPHATLFAGNGGYGSAVEALLLSFALADRIHVLELTCSRTPAPGDAEGLQLVTIFNLSWSPAARRPPGVRSPRRRAATP